MKKTVCVIVNYNDADTTIAQLMRIRDYKSLDAVVIVDNASTDDSLVRLKALVRDRVLLVQADHNGGYGAGNNLGIRYASEVLHADYALIANPDAEFTDDCAAALVKVMERHRELGVIAPVQLNPSSDPEAGIPGTRANALSGAAAWPLRSWFRDLLESGPVSRRLFTRYLHYPRNRFAGKRCAYVDCVPGSLLLADIGKFLQAGGYDEEVFLYEEEYILGFNMRELGYRTALLLEQSYVHRHAVSIGRTYRQLLSRQKLREKASLHYYAYYLGVTDLQLFLTRCFYAVVNLEVLLFGSRAGKTEAHAAEKAAEGDAAENSGAAVENEAAESSTAGAESEAAESSAAGAESGAAESSAAGAENEAAESSTAGAESGTVESSAAGTESGKDAEETE